MGSNAIGPRAARVLSVVVTLAHTAAAAAAGVLEVTAVPAAVEVSPAAAVVVVFEVAVAGAKDKGAIPKRMRLP
jgi:hypothetical protein